MATVVWLHGGACNGNTQSFLNAEEPTVVDLVTDFGIDIIYHHWCIPLMGEQAKSTLLKVLADGGPDIFVMEGTVIQGPNGSGRYDMFLGRPMTEWVRDYAAAAKFTVAIGDCACWGGIPATKPNPTDSVGLQYLKGQHGGFLGKNYRSKAGLPVINIPGCPAHPDRSRKCSSRSPAAGSAISRSTICSARRRSSRRSRRRAARATSISSSSSPSPSSARGRARAVSSTNKAAAARSRIRPATGSCGTAGRARHTPACRASAAPSRNSRTTIWPSARCSRRRSPSTSSPKELPEGPVRSVIGAGRAGARRRTEVGPRSLFVV